MIVSADSALAILGGVPCFEEPLHVGRPNLGDRASLLRRITKMLDRNWLTNDGPFVRKFERRVAELLGVEHCVAMCNATVALEIAIRALGLNGEVIVPSFTFVATAHALQWQEITPVFCDINPATHVIDPACVEQLITPRTTGIIGVHLWGHPCPTDRLSDIAKRHRLKLLFDAAHAIGCSYRGRMIGGFGEAEVFSFHATKLVHCFEGGSVVTNNAVLAEKMRLMRNFGFSGHDNVVYLGTNGKMTEVSAAMGLTSLESMQNTIASNLRNYRTYRKQLAGVPGLRLITHDESESCNYQYILVDVDAAEAGLTRDELMKVLWAENVRARRYFYPGCHRMEPYRSYYPHSQLLLPNTEYVAQRVLVLPTGTSVEEEEVEQVCSILRLAVENADAVAAHVRHRIAPARFEAVDFPCEVL